ncbi:UNVERIFIED_CONTAM: Heat shock protein 8 [Sesamum radiatum]|uniref:Heat shock protein 8 n=1 Tax=Sesamum radiatum TaxID=300843 RepID=A0AAW2UC97_SESRA
MAEPAYLVASDSETTGEEKSSSPFPDIGIGIDIGTSQCSVAVWSGSQVELVRNTRNQKLMRSYVTFKDEIPAGGVSNQLAHEYEMLSGAAIFNMKRLIGRVDTDPVVHASKSLPFLVQTLNIGVRPFIAALVKNMWRSTTPEEVLAIFLVELRAMAEVQLKRPVRNVVLTIPVSFSRFQITRIERACAMAGLQVLRLMPEPTAVALLYAQQQQQNVHENMGSGSEKIALIFNMGAGFCDVAVTATAGGVSQIKALAGTALGGEDILLNMMRHLLPDMDSHFSTRGIDEIRRMGCFELPHKMLSTNSPHSPLFKLMLTWEMEEKYPRLLVEVEDVSDVILVGGCSNIPKLRNIITGVCKREIYNGINPLEAAVRGAALEGAVASGVNDPFGSLDLLTIQATPLSIG